MATAPPSAPAAAELLRLPADALAALEQALAPLAAGMVPADPRHRRLRCGNARFRRTLAPHPVSQKATFASTRMQAGLETVADPIRCTGCEHRRHCGGCG